MNRQSHPPSLTLSPARPSALAGLLCAAALFCVCGCHRILPVDTTPLDSSGMSFSTIRQLKDLNISAAEVQQLVTAKGAGLSDDGCLKLIELARSRKEKFASGDIVAGLLRAGVNEGTVLELAHLHQLHSWGGEAQAMRLAGLPDPIILEEAQQRAAGLAVLSGASLANMKNTGMSEATLLELVRLGVPEHDAATILRLRRRGWSDRQILGHYARSARHRN